jgi:hypothetical protein
VCSHTKSIGTAARAASKRRVTQWVRPDRSFVCQRRRGARGDKTTAASSTAAAARARAAIRSRRLPTSTLVQVIRPCTETAVKVCALAPAELADRRAQGARSAKPPALGTEGVLGDLGRGQHDGLFPRRAQVSGRPGWRSGESVTAASIVGGLHLTRRPTVVLLAARAVRSAAAVGRMGAI